MFSCVLLPWSGAPWNAVCSQNLVCLLSTFYNSCRRRGFNSNRRQLQGGSRLVNFEDIYKSGFLPALPSLDLNDTIVWEDGGGWFPFIQCLSWHCLGYLPKTPLQTDIKIEVPRFQLVPFKPQPCSSTSAASTSHIWTPTSTGLL